MAEVSRESRFCSVRVLRRHKTRRRGLSRNRRSRYRSTRRSRPRLKFGERFESQSLFSPTTTVDSYVVEEPTLITRFIPLLGIYFHSAIALSPATIDGRAMQRFVSPIQVYNGVHRPRALFEGRTSNVKRVDFEDFSIGVVTDRQHM